MVGVAEKSSVPTDMRPGTASARPGTAAFDEQQAFFSETPGRPGSGGGASAGFRPGSSMGIARPGTPAAAVMSEAMRPGSAVGARPGSAMGAREPGFGAPGARSSSDLTFGSNTALCGNITSALRKRKKDVVFDPVAVAPEELLPHERAGYEAKKGGGSPPPDIMVITHDDSPGYISGSNSPPVSPVVFDEGEDAEAEPGILGSWD